MPRRPKDSPNWGGPRLGSGRKVSTGRTVKTVAVSLPIELAEWLHQAASEREIPQSRFVAQALEYVRLHKVDLRMVELLKQDSTDD